jgi:hypothetical protein
MQSTPCAVETNQGFLPALHAKLPREASSLCVDSTQRPSSGSVSNLSSKKVVAEAVAKAAADTSKILVVDMVLLLLSKTMMKVKKCQFLGGGRKIWKEPRWKKEKKIQDEQ